jgi:hypothetical protein
MLRLLHPFSGPEVSAVKMTITFHAPDPIDTVRPLFKGVEDMKEV